MKAFTGKNLYVVTGLLLALAATCFMLINIVNEFVRSTLYKATGPVLQNPAKQQFGRNSNLLLLFGPVPALLQNGLLGSKTRLQFTKRKIRLPFIHCQKLVEPGSRFLSGGSLLILFAYLPGENYNG